MKSKPNSSHWVDYNGKLSVHGSKRALLPKLMAPEDYGRSYNMGQLQAPTGWVAKLLSLITKG